MVQPTAIPEPPPPPLPLFRPEALAEQRQKFYGEILLIRPFSITLMVWLGIGVSAVVLAFLLLGTYMEKAHVPGVLLPAKGGEQRADVYVPANAVKTVKTSEPIVIHCQSCTGMESQARSGTVDRISTTLLSPEEIVPQVRTAVSGPMYKVTLTLSQTGAEPLPEGTVIRADVPLGRRPLLEWLFERGKAGDK